MPTYAKPLQEKKKGGVDYIFLSLTITLVVMGLFAFFSASLGVLAKNQAQFYQILISQLALGLVGRSILLFAGMRIPYAFWRKHAGKILIAAILFTSLVYIPGLVSLTVVLAAGSLSLVFRSSLLNSSK